MTFPDRSLTDATNDAVLDAAPPVRAAEVRPWRARQAVAPAVRVAAVVAVLVPLCLIGAGLVTRGTGEIRIPGVGTTAVLRAVLFAALTLHAGELAVTRMARTVRGAPASRPRSWAVGVSLLGAVAAVAQIVQLAGLGSLAAGLADPDGLLETYGTLPGQLALLQANAFLAAAYCASRSRPAWAVTPLALVVIAEAVRAHPEVDSPAVGVALTVVHLTAAALWCGGLLHALRTMYGWRDAPDAARVLLGRYARMAAWLFAALAVTGTASTLRRLPLDQILSSAYGRTLLAKLLLVALVGLLAMVARRRLHRPRRGPSACRAARVELVALGAVVLVSALLTAVPVPVR
ncbi:CopD family protein [Streptomyces sp. 21So2-11]|uniref:CopD family protein n=1 Tax=Streptomyces sp. 21So2-11 TaxID=3144408 RepID=UPI00321C216C